MFNGNGESASFSSYLVDKINHNALYVIALAVERQDNIKIPQEILNYWRNITYILN